MEQYERVRAPDRRPEIAILPFRQSSALERPVRMVVGDSAAWRALWAEITSAHGPPDVVPAVDFAREMLVVAGMGTRPSGGFLIAIDSVQATSGTLRVVVRSRSPGRGCGVTAALTAPVALARITRTGLRPEFVEVADVRNCE